MKTILRIQHHYYCPCCGEGFQHKKHRGWFMKKFLHFIDKYYCEMCNKIYFVQKPR